MKKILGAVSAIGLLAAVLIANYVTSRYGFIPVGFGLQATAGTFAAGFALALRDSTQDLLGKKWMLFTIFIAAAISYLIADPFIALASAAAFLVAELVDFAIYTPLRQKAKLGDRRWAAAVIGSNIGSAFADTIVFLAIAFGWAAVLPTLAGQMVGKLWATAAYLIVGKVVAYRGSTQNSVVRAVG